MSVVHLWFLEETHLARHYSSLPPERNPTDKDTIWIPKSIVEHTTKRGNEHHIKLPDWFVDKNNL